MCSVGLQVPLEDFLRTSLKRTVRQCRFGTARVSVRQCDVTEAVTLSDRDPGVTVPRYKRGLCGNKDKLLSSSCRRVSQTLFGRVESLLRFLFVITACTRASPDFFENQAPSVSSSQGSSISP